MANARASDKDNRNSQPRLAGHPRVSAIMVPLLLLLIAASFPAWAKLVIDVENPNLARMPIAIPDFVSTQPGAMNGRELATILRNDLYLTGLFDILETPGGIAPAEVERPDFQKWAQSGAQALVTGRFRVEGDQLILEARLFDVALKEMQLGKRFRGRVTDRRPMVHKFGDRIMEQLTGIPGCFASRIAFIGASRSREVFSMDFDGHNLRRLTHDGSINLFPEWAPNGRSILFTSYLNGKPDLWSLTFSPPERRLVSARPGINASARYSPDGRAIALSMNYKGIPKIFLITPRGNIIKRLTSGRGNDISPTWSPDGSTIAYVSDQAGSPQLYLIPVGGGQPTRLTFETNYNTDPDWSPRGDLLTFTARVGGRFQICTIRTDGSDYRVLTDQGSNQAPAWSPDGRMISFSSTRNGMRQIFLMDMMGQVQVPVSPIAGKSPAWSRNVK
ncbi:MAG: Tol-Pal system beta propeller repeat protein TolB [Deltaproteobacteria bacterium]